MHAITSFIIIIFIILPLQLIITIRKHWGAFHPTPHLIPEAPPPPLVQSHKIDSPAGELKKSVCLTQTTEKDVLVFLGGGALKTDPAPLSLKSHVQVVVSTPKR